MTLLVLHHQQTAPQQKPVTGLLSELAPVRVMDSKALRYVRIEVGLMITSGEGGKVVY
ncbi:hypothetical protein [Atlantibacter hermannii]|uniref:hypothetical protein n=1 Tax=Atlantibacter hermannii TaxID=565 RepID=UPI0028ADCDF7|nr:hypothetical protein [Atlantibacter hermannii]